jgi:hypothetical protein
VKFKLFDVQINGGIKKLADNGKWCAFGNVNTASKINAGLDYKTLCSITSYAPIFVDNKESVTNIIATESQRICLVVSQTTKF